MEIHEINDIAQLDCCREAWNELLAQTAAATFFHTLDWLEVYWKHFGADQKLRVLVATEAGAPVGIVPLVVHPEATKVGRLRFLTYPLDFWGSFYGPLGPRPEETLAAALHHVHHTRRDWDALELRWVGAGDDDCRRTETAMRNEGFQAHRTILDQTSVIEMDGTWEDYRASRGTKWRTNCRRWRRKLQDRGRIDYVRYRPRGAAEGDENPRWDLFEACLGLAEKSWQGSSTDGTTLSSPSIRPFLRDVHAAAADSGGLDVNLLLIDEQPVAFAYNYCYRDSVYGLRVGYDPATGRDGAGNLLYALTIEDSFLRGDRLYDMGPGSLKAKRHLQTAVRPVVRYSHFPWTALRSQLLRIKRCLDGRTVAA